MYQIKGRIDTNNAPLFEQEIMAALPKEIDASALEYISSAGLRVLLKLKKTVREVSVYNVSNEVYDIFSVTGFTNLLNVTKKMREISVEGCELIGSGGYGKVYRIDEETIVKLYNPSFSLAFVQQERDTSQKAFLMGIPTAISYDVVRCGDCYGVVYELLNAKAIAQLISEDPSCIPQIAGKSAMMLKKMHRVVPGLYAGLPDRKEKMISWVNSLSDYITDEEADRIKDFIRSIPNRYTFLHGDYNAKNVMVQNDELLLIDIGDAAIGHPIFDIAGLMLAYIVLPSSRGGSRSDENLRELLGFDFQYAEQVWSVMCATYFGLSSPDQIKEMTIKLMPYCLLLMTFHALNISGSDTESVKIRVDKVLRERFLPAIENAQPIDF